ncbi:DUF4406 domain-containing protein [Aeromonas hydrophila]|uniref:DUF4406 domain-containing protein n=1 Tax=Aeromonas hydrophila TaxID=644 RepID=UPI003EC8811E
MTNKPQVGAGQIMLEGVKVYVAGPMTGLPEFNRPAFFAAEAHLKSLGAQVMNPAILPDGWSHEAYMRIAIPMLMECEAVAFLPGWQYSCGAAESSPGRRRLVSICTS